MIVRLKRRNGGEAFYTCDAVIHHVEEGRDDWIEVRGPRVIPGMDTCFLAKELSFVQIYDHGRFLWQKGFQ